MIFMLTIISAQNPRGEFFQAAGSAILIQNRTVVFVGAAILVLLCLLVWGLYKRNSSRLKAVKNPCSKRQRIWSSPRNGIASWWNKSPRLPTLIMWITQVPPFLSAPKLRRFVGKPLKNGDWILNHG